ncbi:uncharacterized protein LOC111261916 isoform X3 [Varroa jacobsoni]|uniref:Uncharacterized protein n=1 Tax=Varroa destructor TaxID=109461 RepID=A0A7M7KJP9_VARDE|nr:uncharacterized protein LOC111251861 isoform X2 [Varroa destructor]XP_022691534.1 uncharacterized protein LOC111261916 isoform X3 [Varroa jacobsoni]
MGEYCAQPQLEEESDFERRSAIRNRLTELKRQKREMREAQAKRREDDREQAIRNKAAQAQLQKQRTMDMYDAMAKSGPAGSTKVMDVGIYKRGEAGEGIVTSTNQSLVEDAIKESTRQRELEKKRMLAAFDAAAKSGPAGAPKEVDFEAFRKANVDNYEIGKQDYDPTMQVSGGISLYNPELIKSPKAGTPVTCMNNGPDLAAIARNINPPMDAMQRAIRERQEACDAEKKRILAAYAAAAKQGPGPKQNVLDDFKNVKLDDAELAKPTPSACAGFKGGVPIAKGTDSPRPMRSTCFNPTKPKALDHDVTPISRPPPVLNIRRGSTSTYSLSPFSSPPSAGTPSQGTPPQNATHLQSTSLDEAARKLEGVDAAQKALQARVEAAELERQRVLAAYLASKAPSSSRETIPMRELPTGNTSDSPQVARKVTTGGSTAFRPIPIRPPRPLK